MKKQLHGYFLLVLALPTFSFAYIYDIQILRKWDPATRSYNYIMGCSDYHDRTNPRNKKQRAEIETMLAQCDKNKTKIIVEDLSCAGATNDQAKCGNFIINTRGGILGGLAQYCSQRGLHVDNMEYRYCRVASLGPLLRRARQPLQQFKAINSLSVNTLVDEINIQIRQVEKFNGHPVLKGWYQQSINSINRGLQRLHLDRHKDMTVAQYIASHSRENSRFALLNDLLTFDSLLLDLKLVHSLAQNNNKEKIVVIAGGTHINRMAKMLQKIGYKKIKTNEVGYHQEHNLDRCVGSNIINGTHCIKPHSVEIVPVMRKFLL